METSDTTMTVPGGPSALGRLSTLRRSSQRKRMYSPGICFERRQCCGSGQSSTVGLIDHRRCIACERLSL